MENFWGQVIAYGKGYKSTALWMKFLDSYDYFGKCNGINHHEGLRNSLYFLQSEKIDDKFLYSVYFVQSIMHVLVKDIKKWECFILNLFLRISCNFGRFLSFTVVTVTRPYLYFYSLKSFIHLFRNRSNYLSSVYQGKFISFHVNGLSFLFSGGIERNQWHEMG